MGEEKVEDLPQSPHLAAGNERQIPFCSSVSTIEKGP